MTEKYKGEQEQSPETIESETYKAVKEAQDEVGRILAEMDNVFATTQYRAEAEKIVLEKYAPQMDTAMKKSTQVLDEWLKIMNENAGKEREDL